MAAAVRAACLDFPGAEDGLACNRGIFAPEVAAGVQRADELRRCLELLDGLAQQGDFVLRGEVVLVGVGGKHETSFMMLEDAARFADVPVLTSRNQTPVAWWCAAKGCRGRSQTSSVFIAPRRLRRGETPACGKDQLWSEVRLRGRAHLARQCASGE